MLKIGRRGSLHGVIEALAMAAVILVLRRRFALALRINPYRYIMRGRAVGQHRPGGWRRR